MELNPFARPCTCATTGVLGPSQTCTLVKSILAIAVFSSHQVQHLVHTTGIQTLRPGRRAAAPALPAWHALPARQHPISDSQAFLPHHGHTCTPTILHISNPALPGTARPSESVVTLMDQAISTSTQPTAAPYVSNQEITALLQLLTLFRKQALLSCSTASVR